jgi:hypothetical protein
LGGALDKWNIFLEKIVEKMANLEEVFNEASIEVSKADEALYFFEAFRNGPINNSFNFNWIHIIILGVKLDQDSAIPHN